MNYTPVIQTERLILRPMKPDDYNDFLEYFTDEAISGLIGGYQDYSEKENAMLLFKKKLQTQCTWAMELKQTGKVIGDIHFYNIVGMYLAEVGYMTNRQFWRNGYASEALSAILKYSFDTLGFGRIRAKTLLQNTASINLLKHCGFKQEALIYEDNYSGRIGSVFYFSISNCE